MDHRPFSTSLLLLGHFCPTILLNLWTITNFGITYLLESVALYTSHTSSKWLCRIWTRGVLPDPPLPLPIEGSSNKNSTHTQSYGIHSPRALHDKWQLLGFYSQLLCGQGEQQRARLPENYRTVPGTSYRVCKKTATSYRVCNKHQPSVTYCNCKTTKTSQL